jgi:tight adherence protein B
MSGRRWTRALGAFFIALGLTGTTIVGAWAEGEGNIDHAETKNGVLRVLYSVPELEAGVTPDLSTLQVTVNGNQLDAKASLAAEADATEQVRRTAILAMDVSKSMRGERFEQAQAAAKAYLETVPPDVYVGIVAFAGSVEVVQVPALDRESAATVIDGLTLSLQTRLYDGVVASIKAAGKQGQRSILVLSDGLDTSKTELDSVITAIDSSEVQVDVVALGEEAQGNKPLETMASEGDGAVFGADPESLTALFNKEAEDLARQLLVTARLPDDFREREGSVTISVEAAGEIYSGSAFVLFGKAAKSDQNAAAGPRALEPPTFLMTREALLAGLGALALGVLVVLLSAFGVFGRRDKTSVEDHIAAYTRTGGRPNQPGAAHRQPAAAGQSRGVAASAVDMAQKALQGSTGTEARLGDKLEAAGLSLKPAEWILIHAGIALGAAALGLLLSSGGFLPATLFLLVGAVVPWLYLGIKKSRRLKAFEGQLADTLQLIAGSLSAGLSLAQSLDTVVREGSEPVAGEFRRALVESRLGVQIEDSLDSIAQRMESEDFRWIVMAIRIQREIGGNLSELLLKVAATMRERDYLRRQVKTLSAEGKMSAWILSGLPPAIFAYMLVANPSYVQPMLTTPLGWAMLAGAGVLMAVGALWMSRVVKVDV